MTFGIEFMLKTMDGSAGQRMEHTLELQSWGSKLRRFR